MRELCPHFKEAYALSMEGVPLTGHGDAMCHDHLPRGGLQSFVTTRATVWPHGLMELLFMDGDLDDLVARHATLRELREAAPVVLNPWRKMASGA